MYQDKLQLDPVATAMFEAASRKLHAEGPRKYLGMSSIGHPCERKLWYSFRQYTPRNQEGRAEMIFSLGNAVEKEVLCWLRTAGYTVEGQQEEFSALNGLFAGHCDGIIHGVTQRPHILEIKSASASRFKAFQTGTICQVAPTYAAQVQCYMGYSGLDRAIFVVMNKNTCEIYTERVHFDYQMFKELEAKAARIISSNDTPARAFIQESPECRLCEFAGHCWHSPYVQTRQTCGSCYYLGFSGIRPHCTKHGRWIKHWGMGCSDWTFRDLTDTLPAAFYEQGPADEQ